MASNTDKVKMRLLASKNIKEWHYLQHIWTFYYLIPNRQGQTNKNWYDFLKPLHDFSNFEDFWAIMNTIAPPRELPKGCRYYIFKQGIKPLWEDERNLGGRELFAEYPIENDRSKQRQKGQKGRAASQEQVSPANVEAESHWKDLALSVLANAKTIPHIDKINGIEFNCRGGVIKVGVWVAPGASEAEFEDINRGVRDVLKSEKELGVNVIITEEEKNAQAPAKPEPASPTK